MPTKKDLEELIIRVDERTKRIPEIEKHLGRINGTLSTQALEIMEASNTATNAEEKATSTRGYVDKLTICFISGGVALIGCVVALAVIK